jgi:hypothetical protein
MGKQILETNNYSKFDMMGFNRDVGSTKKLENSMIEHGFLDACPLHVVRNGGGRLLIKQGHHRFVAAKNLGIPVKYVESKDNVSIAKLEETTRRWSMNDYLTSFCRLGNQEYVQVRKYCDETGISVAPAIALLGGHSAGTANFHAAFKDGSYKINHKSKHADNVKELVLFCKYKGLKFYNTNLLVSAFSKLLWVEEFKLSQMKLKIKSFHSYMEKKASLDQYLDMLEDVYNRQSRSKIPLKFLSYEAAKARNVIPHQK